MKFTIKSETTLDRCVKWPEKINWKVNMHPLIYIPLESITERYSESWYRNFPDFFAKAGFDVRVIDGIPLRHNEIKVGSFLDINSTVHFKSSQMQGIAELFDNGKIADGTVFFVADIEFWGIEAIRLMADMNKVKIHLTGFLHAASYTKEDAFAIAEPYQQYTELGWLAAFDKVFVGSKYHKQAVIERRLNPLFDYCPNYQGIADKIVVTKNPLFLNDYPIYNDVPKEKKIVLTNRFDTEKRPIETLELFEKVAKLFPHWEFVVTTGRPKLRGTADTAYAYALQDLGIIKIKDGLTKDQYHRELASASIMVTHSIEEHYGYCLAESLLYGCLPFARAGLSHDEFIPPYCRNLLMFETDEQAYAKLIQLIALFETEPHKVPSFPVDELGANRIVDELLAMVQTK